MIFMACDGVQQQLHDGKASAEFNIWILFTITVVIDYTYDHSRSQRSIHEGIYL